MTWQEIQKVIDGQISIPIYLPTYSKPKVRVDKIICLTDAKRNARLGTDIDWWDWRDKHTHRRNDHSHDSWKLHRDHQWRA